MTKPFICLIGAGRWGQNLLRDFHKLGVLAAVCDSDSTRRKQLSAQYSDLIWLSQVEELSKYPQIKAICLATPATTHYKLGRLCMEMGYDIMIEKPLALKYSEGIELVKLARENKLILMVGHLLQYHPTLGEIHKMIKEGMLGEIQYLKSNRLNLGQIRDGENVLWSFAPHDISLILGLLGDDLPKEVLCSGFSGLYSGIYDTTTTILKFNKQYAEINVNWLYPYKEHSLVVVGKKGIISFQGSREDEIHFYRQPVTYNESSGSIVLNKREPEIILVDDENTPLELECQHFMECCLKRLEPRTNGDEALRVLAVLELAQRSLDEKHKVMGISDLNILINSDKSYWTHPSAVIDTGAQIGKGTKVWHNSHVMKAVIGHECNLGQGVFVGNGVVIGNRCRIQNNVNIYSGVICEDGVFLGPNCTTTNDKIPRAEYSKNGKYLKTLIRQGASVGAGAVLVAGIVLGRYCQVGAGSVVTKDVPDYTLVMGNPARVVGKVGDFELFKENELSSLSDHNNS